MEDESPNLATGYRIGAVCVGVIGIIASLLLMILSVPVAVVMLACMILVLYIGITGDQKSWAARWLMSIMSVFRNLNI